MFIEYLAIGYNRDMSEELVITRVVPQEQIVQVGIEVLYTMKGKWYNQVFSKKTLVVAPKPGFWDHESIQACSREKVKVIFYFTRNGYMMDFRRILNVSEQFTEISKQVSYMNNYPGIKFQAVEVKEFFNSQRIRQILARHFGEDKEGKI